MSYKVAFHPEAKQESTELGSIYGIADELRRWQLQIAYDADAGITTESLDLVETIEDLLERGEQWLAGTRNPWKCSWERLKKAPWLEKAKALWVVIRRRCPPWEFRMAVQGFLLLDFIPHEIIAYYTVEHPRKTVVFRKFELGERLVDYGGRDERDGDLV